MKYFPLHAVERRREQVQLGTWNDPRRTTPQIITYEYDHEFVYVCVYECECLSFERDKN